MTTTARRAATVLVADPHACVRAGLRALLDREPDLRVAWEAADGPTAVALAAEQAPDVVVLDVMLPEFGGREAVARLREAHADAGVLVLTACEDAGATRACLGAGARGYVLKTSAVDQLVRAVRAVAAGGTFIDPRVAGALVGPGATGGSAPDLSEREAEVVRRIAAGYSNKEIAAQLNVSVKTVETYKSRAMEKLHLRGRVDIVRYAVGRGWLAEPAPAPPDGDEGP